MSLFPNSVIVSGFRRFVTSCWWYLSSLVFLPLQDEFKKKICYLLVCKMQIPPHKLWLLLLDVIFSVSSQDTQVYRYYRDLINFRCCGDPALMLRCINPRESKLLDPAAGIHIKFRLAGVSPSHVFTVSSQRHIYSIIQILYFPYLTVNFLIHSQ